jgi:DNA polymerase zeta
MTLRALRIGRSVNTRGTLLPDPEFDEIAALFYCLKTENEGVLLNGRVPETHVGVLAVGKPDLLRKIGKTEYVVEVVESEHELFNRFIDLVRYDWDPEAVAGYEVHRASWGYLLERAQVAHGELQGPSWGKLEDSG